MGKSKITADEQSKALAGFHKQSKTGLDSSGGGQKWWNVLMKTKGPIVLTFVQPENPKSPLYLRALDPKTKQGPYVNMGKDRKTILKLKPLEGMTIDCIACLREPVKPSKADFKAVKKRYPKNVTQSWDDVKSRKDQMILLKFNIKTLTDAPKSSSKKKDKKKNKKSSSKV